ncbi:MAG TPA: hypothetical protein VIQ02_11435 [Jiangellaceae bacterium]
MRTNRAAIIPQVDDPVATYHLTTYAKTRPQVVAADAFAFLPSISRPDRPARH